MKDITITVEHHNFITRCHALHNKPTSWSDDWLRVTIHDVSEEEARHADQLIAAAAAEIRSDINELRDLSPASLRFLIFVVARIESFNPIHFVWEGTK